MVFFADTFARNHCLHSEDGMLVWNCLPHNCHYHDNDKDAPHGFHGCRIFCMMRDKTIYG